MANDWTVEDALHQIEERLSMLNFLCHCAASSEQDAPDPRVWHGISETCAEAEKQARAVRKTLSADALGISLKPA
jgi:hypothetical protein